MYRMDNTQSPSPTPQPSHRSHTALIIAAIIVFLLAVGLVFWIFIKNSQMQQSENLANQKKMENQAVENLSKSLSDATEGQNVTVPSANPLDQAVPAVNPLEKTNPFNDEYANPFN